MSIQYLMCDRQNNPWRLGDMKYLKGRCHIDVHIKTKLVKQFIIINVLNQNGSVFLEKKDYCNIYQSDQCY